LRLATIKAAQKFANATFKVPHKAGQGSESTVALDLLELVSPQDEKSSPALEEVRLLRADTLVILARWLQAGDSSEGAIVAKLEGSLADEPSVSVRRKLSEGLELVSKLRHAT
jgi:hypothetical protein